MPLTTAEKSKRYRERLKNDPEKYKISKEKSRARSAKQYNEKKKDEDKKHEMRIKWRLQKQGSNKESQSEVQVQVQDIEGQRRNVVDAHEDRHIGTEEPISTERTGNINDSESTRQPNKIEMKLVQRNVVNMLRRNNAKLQEKVLNLERGLLSLKREMRNIKKMFKEVTEQLRQVLPVVEQEQKETDNVAILNQNETPLKRSVQFVQNHLAEASIETPKKEAIKQKIFEYNVLTDSLKQTYKSCQNSEKKLLKEVVDNEFVKKYKITTNLTQNLGLKSNIRKTEENKKKSKELKEKLKKFYERDDVSRASAGKKECLTYKKCKKQKRYLLDKLRNLHKKYVTEVETISFSTFKKHRPFYVISPTLKDLETCACIKHANMKFIALALKSHKVLVTSDLNEIISTLVCDNKFKNCMYGECNICSENVIGENATNNGDATWFMWILKDHEYSEKGDLKKTKKMVKVEKNGTVQDLIDIFNKDMKVFKKHVFNVYHQYQQYKFCKDNLDSKEAMIHIDFSENWVCKHTEEIQAMHFGASKKQITLHTGMLYVKNESPYSFCSISPDNSHNPEAIWAHLNPILKHIKLRYPDIDYIHFFSDGPTSQYRQKKNFFLFSRNIYDLGFSHASWSFFEAAHGKGAADGIGGAIKRTLDFKVAHGLDIPDGETAYDILSKTETDVKIFYIPPESIKPLDEYIAKKLIPLPNTMKIHQVVTNGKYSLKHRELSCFCQDHGKCECYFPRLHIFETEQETENLNNENTVTQYELDETTGNMRVVQPTEKATGNEQIGELNDNDDDNFINTFDLEDTDINVVLLNDSALLNEMEREVRVVVADKNTKENHRNQCLKRKRESSDTSGHRKLDQEIQTKRKIPTMSRHIRESSEEDEGHYSVHDSSYGSIFLEDGDSDDAKSDKIKDEDDNIEVSKDSYVLVKFILQRGCKFYIGKVVEIIENDSYKVKFLRHKGKGKFVWPANDDVSLVYKTDIEKVLGNPLAERRGIKTFDVLKLKYKID